tara:strand:+ start:153 stop:662 length:510 start_codon:yes stop_codon:yes gene_type:complete
MKKGFTLIELLIVVAIIGILAGVGIPMYNGYMLEAKINASQANHSNIKNFVAAALAKCASGSAEVELPGFYLPLTCSQTANQNMGYVVQYFNDITGTKNPYNGGLSQNDKGFKYGVYSSRSCGGYNSQSPSLGSSSLGACGNSNTIYLSTNIGDESGGNVYLRETFLKE